MPKKLACITLFAVLLGATPAAEPTAEPAAQIDITTLTCKDLRDASPLDRSAMVMFYWGYAAAKASATTFKTGVLRNATAALMQECDKSESETILQAMQR